MDSVILSHANLLLFDPNWFGNIGTKLYFY